MIEKRSKWNEQCNGRYELSYSKIHPIREETDIRCVMIIYIYIPVVYVFTNETHTKESEGRLDSVLLYLLRVAQKALSLFVSPPLLIDKKNMCN